MDETYTCLCGNQTFFINGSIVTCGKCGQVYNLVWRNMESPENFNERIRKEKKVKE